MKSLLLNIRVLQESWGNKILSIGLFALFFALIKINTVSALLIASNFTSSTEVFGMLDYAIGLALILSVIFNAGMPGSYPYFILKKEDSETKPVFYLHGLLIGVFFMFIHIILLFFGIGYDHYYQLLLAFTSVFCLQILSSFILKTNENIYKALIVEGGVFIILNIYNLYLFLTNGILELVWITLLLFGYSLFLTITYGYKLYQSEICTRSKYGTVLKYGITLVLNSFLILSLTGTGRIFIEYFLGMEEVGIYGIYFRMAALLVIVYQIINASLFRFIYTCSVDKMDTYIHLFLASLILIAVVFYHLFPILFVPLFTMLSNTWLDNKFLFFLLLFQMIFWIILALLENIINREGLARLSNIGLFFLMLIFIVYIIAFNQSGILDIELIVFWNTMLLFIACEWKMTLIQGKNILLHKTSFMLRLVFVGMLLLTLIHY